MLSPVWRAAADREMHLMHFYYRLGEKRGREEVVDKTKAWWVDRVYCFFQLSGLPSHTNIGSLLHMQAHILYLQTKPLLLQQCGREIWCVISAMKGKIFLGKTHLSVMCYFSRDFSLPMRGIGQHNSGKHPSFVTIEKLQHFSLLLLKILHKILSWLFSHGTCIPLLHTIKAWFIFSLLCVFDNVI